MVMRQMRENTKIIMLVTALAFVALMVFEWGMDASGRSSAEVSGGEIGRVNGEPITYEAFLQTYRALYDQQQAQRDAPISPAENRQIEDAAWEQLVQERLVAQELARRGITATDEEVRQAARYAPPPEFYGNELFLTDGEFDLAKYHQFLASPAVDDQLLGQLEQYYRGAIPRSKLFRQVASGVFVTDGELWRMWRDRNERVRVAFATFDPAQLVPDAAVTVTDDEVRRYYDENIEELERPARARVRVLSLDKTPTRADTAAVLAQARDLRQQILGGTAFEDVAQQWSEDPSSASRGGDLGAITRGQTVPAFEEAVFSLPLGQVSEPVLTQFGYHVIQVREREGDEAQVRHILLPIVRTDESEGRLLTRADSLEEAGEVEGLAAAARRMRLEPRELQLSEGTPFLPLIGNVDDGADWAFREAEVGQTSPVFENDQRFYMLELVELTPAGRMSFEETRDQLRERVLDRKKLDRVRQLAREAADRVRSGTPLQAAVASYDVPVQEAGPFSRVEFVPGLGQANAAVGVGFGLKPGQLSAPVEADGRLYLIQLLEHVTADRQAWEAQKAEQRARVTAALEQARLTQYLEDLREQAEIVDARAQVLRPAA